MNAKFLEQCLEMARGDGTWCLIQGAVPPGKGGGGQLSVAGERESKEIHREREGAEGKAWGQRRRRR